ncbi:PD40 domain-containing protein [Algoriphagus sp. Y33]|uniref:PD40 domain-containing protein n=1 Tax=Algoriphagus sp. Y33 TaxID=2772483 RepID=UPI0017828A10|nr:PD40 domain-containing protein [Algoriphagus sp. Y33]
MKNFGSILLFLLSISAISCSQFPEPSPVNYELYVSDRDQYPKFSPDGEHIAYYHVNSQLADSEDYPTGLYIIDKNGNNRRLVLRGTHLNPAWSPDGQWLVFSTSGVLQKCKTDGDSLMTFKENDLSQYSSYFFPDWISNGTEILFDRAENIAGESNLLSIKKDFTGLRPIFGNFIVAGRDPELSPSGGRLVYTKASGDWDGWRIFAMDTTGDNELMLTENNNDNRSPTWSADGQMIAWSKNVRIHVMDSDGNNQTPLSPGVYPSWSVQGEIVYSHANHDYSKEVLYMIDPDESNRRQLTF